MAQLLAKHTSEEPTRKLLREPFSIPHELERLADEIQRRAYGLFEHRGHTDGFDLEDWLRAESEVLRHIPVDVEMTDKDVVVKAEVPGFKASELSITVEPTFLSLFAKSTKKESEETKEKVYSELSTQTSLRQVMLPIAVNPEESTAQLHDGVLEIHMPKAAPAKSIEIRPAA